MQKLLKPPKMWIDGKTYIINITKNTKISERCLNNPKDKMLVEQEDIQEIFNIIEHSPGTFSSKFMVPNIYSQGLLNFPSFCVNTLASTTNTVISYPKQPEDKHWEIVGDNHENIAKARHEIHSVLGLIRQNRKPDHFISIPIRNEEILEKFNEFKNLVLAEKNINGVENSIFISPYKLHLTIDVFCLLDEAEVNEAAKTLQEYKTKLSNLVEKTGPLNIKISGLECMQKNYSKVNVLYANAEIMNCKEEYSLQKIVNDIAEHFYEKGFTKNYQNNVKLHVTLMNTKYRDKANNGSKRRKFYTRRQTFNATTIMEKYKNFNFGICNLNNIRLSLMTSKDDDGFYKTVSSIEF